MTSGRRLIEIGCKKAPHWRKDLVPKVETSMKTRITPWAIFVMFAPALIGCGGSNTSYNPVSPSPPPPPIATPTPPPRSLTVDLTGNYALTFEVGNACEHIPKELRTRTYEARIEYERSYGSTDEFRADLSGATFLGYRPVLIDVTGNSVHVDLSDNAIVEEPSPRTFVAISGAGGVASVEPGDLSTISASFIGYFNYCAVTSESAGQNQCLVDAMVRGMCKSENSRWTLTRR
jgi:hypothetical protein